MTVDIGTPIFVPVSKSDNDAPDYAMALVTRVWYAGDEENKPMVNVTVFADGNIESRNGIRLWDTEPDDKEVRTADIGWYANPSHAPIKPVEPTDEAASQDGDNSEAPSFSDAGSAKTGGTK